MIFHPVSLGIIFGLVLGKFIGISFFTWLITALNLSSLPDGVNMKEILAGAMLAGIGFTMSLFIADLAFDSPEIVQIAKVGIFTASILAAIIGMIMLSRVSSKKVN